MAQYDRKLPARSPVVQAWSFILCQIFKTEFQCLSWIPWKQQRQHVKYRLSRMARCVNSIDEDILRKEMIEIKLRGRGGQGVVIASEILGRAFFWKGSFLNVFQSSAASAGVPRLSDFFVLMNSRFS